MKISKESSVIRSLILPIYFPSILMSIGTGIMNYPAASYGVSIVIPAYESESRNILDWIPDQVRDDGTKQSSGN